MPGYDYTGEGSYFVTLCTHNRECVFGTIINGEMVLNELGSIVQRDWLRTAQIRPNIELGAFVVMPNHVHVIFTIKYRDLMRAWNDHPALQIPASKPNSISSVIRGFKSTATRRVNQSRQSPGEPVWQRNYYEHIIRDDNEMQSKTDYIEGNPSRWTEDEENLG